MSVARNSADGGENIRAGAPTYQARAIRQNHQQLQHVINRILNRLEVPDKAARGISGIHGVLNGREKLPAFIAHKWTARQLNFRGDDQSAKKFMCRVLDAIRDAERKCGRRFFAITRADDVVQKITSYDADYIGEAALWALLEAKASPEWAKNPAKAVTDELIDRAVERLPECEAAAEGEGGASLTDADVIKGIWTKVENLAAKNLERIVEAGGDPVKEVGRIQDRLMKLAIIARRQMLERDRLALVPPPPGSSEPAEPAPPEPALFPEEDAVAEAPDPEDTPAESAPPEGETGVEGGGQSVALISQNPNKNDPFSGADPRTAALAWAAQGAAVFPLYGVADGVCDCREGSECRSAGKHPLARLAPRGVKDATTDPDTIRRWWAAAPLANVGIAMGGPLRLLAVDVDPRAGGDASLCDLVEAHGDGWLSTFTVRTGGLGHHFIYRLPEGVEVHRGKLAPGIDVKSEGGYLVAAPSVHASGRRYEVERNAYALEAPAWLVEELTRAPSAPPARVIEFQERRAVRSGDPARIPEGERNRRVFEIGCAIWGAGEAADAEGLYRKLLEEVYPRCDAGVKPFTPADVWKIANSIMRYPRGVPRPGGEAA